MQLAADYPTVPQYRHELANSLPGDPDLESAVGSQSAPPLFLKCDVRKEIRDVCRHSRERGS
jgi:hypothetical protein